MGRGLPDEHQHSVHCSLPLMNSEAKLRWIPASLKAKHFFSNSLEMAHIYSQNHTVKEYGVRKKVEVAS